MEIKWNLWGYFDYTPLFQTGGITIVMGLCVGHDSLFLKYSDAPCTVLVAKDRLLGHNPLAAIYTIDSYYRSLKR